MILAAGARALVDSAPLSAAPAAAFPPAAAFSVAAAGGLRG